MPDHGLEHAAALLEANSDDWDTAERTRIGDRFDSPRCGAYGPYGECHRAAGHYDNDCGASYADILLHITYDNDRFQSWPVSWKSAGEKIALVLDPTFLADVAGTEEYRRGVADALARVREVLGTPRRVS